VLRPRGTASAAAVPLQERLRLREHPLVHDRCLLPVMHLVLVANLTDVGDVREQVVQRLLVEGSSAASSALPRRPALGSPAPAVEFLHDRQQRLPLQVHLKDLADAIGFGLVHDELRVDHRVPQDRHPARPLALATGGRDLVPRPFRDHLPLELSKRQQDIQHQQPAFQR